MFYYTLYSLLIESTIALPELLAVGSDHKPASDVQVVLDRERQYTLPDEKTRSAYLLDIPTIGRYFISGGNSIIMQPEPDTSDKTNRVYLLGTAFAMLLYQRGLLPFHASSVETPHGAVLIAGQSGVGKSTTAAALQRLRGFRLIADDVSVAYAQDGYPYVVPAYPQVKLWDQSLNMLGMNTDRFERLTNSDDKFAVPLTHSFRDQPMQIAALYVILPMEISQIHLMQISYAEKVLLLQRQIYRGALMREISEDVLPFDLMTAFLKHVRIARIYRPLQGNSLDAMLELIEQSLIN